MLLCYPLFFLCSQSSDLHMHQLSTSGRTQRSYHQRKSRHSSHTHSMLRQPTVTPHRLCPGRVEVCAWVVLCCSRDIGVDLHDYPDKCASNPFFQPYASGGDGSDIQFCSWLYVSKFLFVTLRLTRTRNRVRRVGSDLELCHHRPPGYESKRTVSAEWSSSLLT